MATHNGRQGKLTVNAETSEKVVLEIGSWSMDISAAEIDTTVFGDGWGKSDVGMKKWSGGAEGFYDPGDATGQKVLLDAFESGALLNDVRFYTKYSETPGDQVIYFAPDVVSDANAGLRVTGYSTGQDKAGVAKLSFKFSGSGPIKSTTETLT